MTYDENYKPYSYLIGWSKLNKWYYGIEFGVTKKVTPDNLWKSYFTSSKEVKKLRKEYGEPDIIQVRKVFDNPNLTIDEKLKRTLLWETKVLKRLNVLKDEKWLNGSVIGGIDGRFIFEIRVKNRTTNKGKKFPNRKPNSYTEESYERICKPKSEEHRQKMKVPKSEEHKEKLRKPKSEEHRQKLRKPKSVKRGPYTEEELKKFIGLKYWTNGLEEVKSKECPDGWWNGRKNSIKQSISKTKSTIIEYNGQTYFGYKELYRMTGITKYYYQKNYKVI